MELLVLTLQEIKDISLAEGRIRDVFYTQAVEKYIASDKERVKVIENFCKRDDDGKPVVIAGQYKFNDEVIEEYNKEISLFFQETVELPSDNKDQIVSFIERTKYEPKAGQSVIIDALLAEIKL